MQLPTYVYRKVGGFALMFGALLLVAGIKLHSMESSSGVLRVSAGTIPYVQAHIHPDGDPDAPHAHWVGSDISTIVPMDMWVTSIHPVITNAPPDILHHVLLYELGPENTVCSNTFKNVREWYAASMNTMRDPAVFPEPYGIFFKKGTQLAIEAMEHTAEEPKGPGGIYTNVGIAVELDYVSADDSRRTRPLDFYRLRLDDTPCSYPMRHEAFVVPISKETFIKKSNFEAKYDGGRNVFEKSGTIIGMGANFWPWKGGKVMRAVVNGKEVASLSAVKREESWAWSIPQHTKEVHIEKGDVIEAQMEYQNPYTDKEIKDASGMLGFYFAED